MEFVSGFFGFIEKYKKAKSNVFKMFQRLIESTKISFLGTLARVLVVRFRPIVALARILVVGLAV